ncbi:MAG TPA: serine hydrolase domain-containing protein [Opitutaceae bacterium]|nr:serine hydrolase domain-containing protein [Opitutaceae bacterium]
MNSLRHPLARTFAFALAGLAASGCSTSAHRDFARLAPPAAAAGEGESQQERPQNPVPPLIRPAAEPVADLGPLLKRIGERNNIPGFTAVVLRGDRIVAEGVAGVRRRGTDVAVTIEDRFQIASCAKAMSAMLIARLVEQGNLKWDQPLTRYFPDHRLHPDWEKITLRHLITHTAGLRDPLVTFLRSTAFDRGSLMERRRAFVERVLGSRPGSPAGSPVAYCNIDYILAAAVAEKVTGKPWEQLMAAHVFAPLGLASGGFGPPGSPGETLQPWGHGKHRLLQVGILGNAAFDPGARGADYPAIASPAGYIHLSIRDWAKFVSLHLRAHPANPNATVAVLRPDTFATLHGTQSELSYAGGWNVGTKPWAKGSGPGDRGRVLFHLGDNQRWSSAVWVAPEKDFAVLIVCNRGDMGKAVDEVASQIVGTYARR